MTPPASLSPLNMMTPSANPFEMAVRVQETESVCEMTFDEMRELPMQVQLGCDLSILD